MNEMMDEYQEAALRKQFQDDFASAEAAWEQINLGHKSPAMMARVVAEADTATRYEVVATTYLMGGHDEVLVSVLSPSGGRCYVMPRHELHPQYVREKLHPDLRNGGDVAALAKTVNAAIAALA